MDQVFINDSAGNHKLPITHFNSVRDSQGNTLTSVLGAVEDSVNEERAYVPADYSGMGRVVLKKNIKTISEVEANYLESSMLTATNTVYVIKYDYTLATDITIPANCVLQFDGGSISANGSNDTITGNNTGIKAGLVKIFSTDVTLAGTWNVDVLNIKWFGAVGDGVTDDTDSFKNCIESPAVANGGYKILINRGKYCISDTIYVPTKSTTICGECKTFVNPDDSFSSCIKFKATNKELFRIVGNTRGITFENLSFDCFSHTINNWYQNTIAIKFQPESTDITSSFNNIIRNCDFLGFANCIYISGIQEAQGWQCDHMIIENCNFLYFSESGIYLNSWNVFDFSSIRNCSFTCHPIDNNIPAIGINVDNSGFFEIVQCAGSAILGAVDENSDAYKYTTLIHLKGHPGTINIDGVQAESIENTVIFETAARHNVIIQNSIIDAKLYVKNTINLQLQNDRFNGNLVIGNGINDLIIDSDNSLNVNKISCEGSNYAGSVISLGNSTINLRDLAYLNGNNFNDLVNPCVYDFVQSESSELVEKEFPLIGSNTGNPYRVQFSILTNFYLGTFGANSLIEFGITWSGGTFNKIGEIVQNDILISCAAKRFDVSVNMAAGTKLVVKMQNIYIEGEIKIESKM